MNGSRPFYIQSYLNVLIWLNTKFDSLQKHEVAARFKNKPLPLNWHTHFSTNDGKNRKAKITKIRKFQDFHQRHVQRLFANLWRKLTKTSHKAAIIDIISLLRCGNFFLHRQRTRAGPAAKKPIKGKWKSDTTFVKCSLIVHVISDYCINL